MSTDTLAPDLERRKQVRMCLRADLAISAQKYEGKTYHVVKDPISLRYYRFTEQEYYILKLMDGEHTLEEAQKDFERRFRPDRLSHEDLERFAQQLVTVGLVHNESPQAGKLLFDKRRKRKRNELLGMLTNLLYIKIPLFDPDRLLTLMVPYLSFIFTKWFFALSVGLMLSALWLVLSHFQTFQDKLPAYQEFFSFKTAIYLWIALGVVKVIHEFGHGLSCKTFGGEVHEMGFLLLCLSPCLYCNVSDSWTMPDKWKRIVISFAGIYVELIIAAIATFVWWNTPSQPFINNLSLSLMVVCSVSTVVFNANPLMRFDGYYVLADWLEIPNLRERSNRYLKNWVLEHCLGIEIHPEPYMALRRKLLFVSYAIGSFIYKWVITFSILWFLSQFLGPKLAAISNLMVMAAVGSMIGWPIFRMIQNLRKRGRLPDMKPIRVTVTGIVLGVAVFAFLFVPLPWISRVSQTGLVQNQPDAMERVFVQTPGILETLYVWDGKYVQKGEILAEFRNLDLEYELELARSQFTNAAAKRQSLQDQLSQSKDEQEKKRIREQIVEATNERQKYDLQLKSLQSRTKDLKLRAPREGVCMSPPRKEDVNRLWEKGPEVPFCTIADPTRLRVLVPVSTADYQVLKEDLKSSRDLPVTIRVQGQGGTTWVGKVHVAELPESEAKNVPVQLTTRGGGPLAIQPGSPNGVLVPQSQHYLVPVEIVDADQSICSGSLAQIKIHVHARSCGWWTWRWIASTFDLPLM